MYICLHTECHGSIQEKFQDNSLDHSGVYCVGVVALGDWAVKRALTAPQAVEESSPGRGPINTWPGALALCGSLLG